MCAGRALIFFLRWTSNWAQQYADAEFSAAQFRRDILRASWVAELLFESAENRSQEGESRPVEIPEFFIEQVTQSLFRGTRNKSSTHPVDDILSYAKQFKKISLTKSGIEVESQPLADE